MKRRMEITERDYIKAFRKASREAEIEDHMRPVSFNRVHKSKKVYDRKREKADDKRHLPSLRLAGTCLCGLLLINYCCLKLEAGL